MDNSIVYNDDLLGDTNSCKIVPIMLRDFAGNPYHVERHDNKHGMSKWVVWMYQPSVRPNRQYFLQDDGALCVVDIDVDNNCEATIIKPSDINCRNEHKHPMLAGIFNTNRVVNCHIAGAVEYLNDPIVSNHDTLIGEE